MAHDKNDKKAPRKRSLALVLLAWVFIGGQALLAAGGVYNLNDRDTQVTALSMPWQLLGQGATKMRLVAAQAQPDILGNIAVFLLVANVVGIAALMCALLAWSRSRHTSGKLTIALAVAVILANSLLNLPYV